jgi:large subunit ribosomal protein L9
MQVVLIQDVDGVGFRGQVVNVSPGYARNFLVPQRLALVASKSTLNVAKEINRAAERKEASIRTEAEGKAQKLDGVSLTITANAGEEGKLFGSVTAADIVEVLNREVDGLTFDKRDVLLREPIKAVGKFHVKIRVFRDIQPAIEVKVVSAQPTEKAPKAGAAPKAEAEARGAEAAPPVESESHAEPEA